MWETDKVQEQESSLPHMKTPANSLNTSLHQAFVELVVGPEAYEFGPFVFVVLGGPPLH